MDVNPQSDGSSSLPTNLSTAHASDPQTNGSGDTPDEKPETLGSFVWFVTKLVIIVLIFRSFVFAPFTIPSESMLPRLWNGDYLLAAKWSYGVSRYSLPFNAPLIPGRLLAGQPERGDTVIFKHPVDQSDYIKRVIGLPGDTVAVVGGRIILNGEPVLQEKVADFVQPVDQHMLDAQEEAGPRSAAALSPCSRAKFEATAADGGQECRYPRLKETLPGGRSYEVLDFENTFADNFAATIVPEGHMFVMGDNRDSSQDSRFPAEAGAGVGMVPQDLLVAKATVVVWSTDGSASWVNPVSWFTATRWDRIGSGL